ncbi:MAG: nucleotidyltransferase family protein [Oscillospiraceae bacterium]|jgi:predicted nucleotidyltransferase|nr:nucleotidyltransferase family protein [Oscillospiraceae bacterium]
MNVIGVIAEYNPFHMGHLYHIAQTKKLVGEDSPVIAVMSGNYVQRGDFAVFNKWTRAEAAVRTLGGADLVIELQAPHSCASAERFASMGVRLLDACGVVTHLSFGSEAGKTDDLQTVAAYLEGEKFNSRIAEELKSGISYAAARQQLCSADLGRVAETLSTPNNTLGIEYLRACIRQGSKLIPVTVERRGAEHDSNFAVGDVASASNIRRMIFSGQAYSAMKYLPEQSIEIAIRDISRGTGPVSLEQNSASILSYLRRLTPEDYAKLPDVSEGLHMRLYTEVRKSRTVAEAAANVKTKRYAMSRIRRILLAAYLSITSEVQGLEPQYLRVLALNNRGRELLRQMKGKSLLPVVTKPTEINGLSGEAKRLFDIEALCTDLYTVSYPSPELRVAGSDFIYSPKFLESR